MRLFTPTLRASVLAAATFGAGLVLRADEPCNCDDHQFTFGGDLSRREIPANIAVSGTNLPDTFAAEVHGKGFTVAVNGLPAGHYTVEIDLAETEFHEAGQREMTIRGLAGSGFDERFDPFARAGGFAKALRITGTLEHEADPIGGPLFLTFIARKHDAFFNAIRVRDASGQLVARVTAAELRDFYPPESLVVPDVKGPEIFRDPDKPVAARVDDLIRRLSIREKAEQLTNSTPAIPRLGIPPYDYWNECLHGVARAGLATVFPQAIGLAAMWDAPLLHRVADTIATEARAKHHEAMRHRNYARYYGLTFWTPNINIFRDPRWGRGQETYGEDPFLTGRLAVAFITGLQGDDPRYIKALACAKHFAVHSGPEPEHHRFDARPPEEDFYDTYLPQFEAAVREGHVGAVMGAYNSVYGVPANASHLLLDDLLRGRWGFDGQVVSDCGAITDIWGGHHFVATPEEACARALKAGCDIECGTIYYALPRALKEGLITGADLDHALRHALTARFRLGLFDPDARVPYAQIPFSKLDAPENGALALTAARESIVLLKNDGVLPLDRTKLKRIAVIGANADSEKMLLANYNGEPSHPVTILQGIKAAAGPAVVEFATGCPLALPKGEAVDRKSPDFRHALELARRADVVIYVGGLTASLEGEEMPVTLDGFLGGDRTKIELPASQSALLRALHATGKPVIFVNCSGSAIAMPWAADNLPAIVQAWYPGQAAGTAVADVLFGNTNPTGRLPVTFYRSTADLPPFDDYAMANRTYRYFAGKPLFAFGHGLSYTKFSYGPLRLAPKQVAAGGTVSFELDVTNTGERDGDEVVQVYAHHAAVAGEERVARESLCAFQRVSVPRGQSVTVKFALPVARFRRWDATKHAYVIDPGACELRVGAASDDIRQKAIVTIAGGNTTA
ncbi:MAG TPA: glycoside hydrolase family 3 C-terminal domain-containing protein [Opitutus sp.]|nr:glycoside hydrolase family 3 C-terminal domain-containing protein [Opitutus sp.]